MVSDSTAVKRQIEATYERDENASDSATDYAGQMTIAFCGTDPSTEEYEKW